MTIISLQRQFERRSTKRLQVKINDNRSTMLSVKWEPHCTKVSLHRMFLNAPENIMDELACYLRRDRKIISPLVKAFIEKNLHKLDYSHELDIRKLNCQGNVYNLRQIYDELNKEYFGRELDLYITWFGKASERTRSRITFGLYHNPLKLIKIHKRMDSPTYPHYLISYVVFHEMLHHVCPPYVDERGLNRVHSKEFKAREKLFKHYDLAQQWIKEHQTYFFG